MKTSSRRKKEGARPAADLRGSPEKPALRDRPLLDGVQTDELVRLFEMLASDTRLRLLHSVERAQELCVTDIAAAIGSTPQAASNQIQRLVDRRILVSRRDGNRIFYRIADHCVAGLIALGLCLLEETGRLPGGPRDRGRTKVKRAT